MTTKATMKNGQTILNMILSACMTLLGALQLWAFTSIVEHGERLAAIEANRFTAADGLEVWQEIAAVRQSVAEMTTRIPTEIPPTWFIHRVDGMEADIKSIETSVQSLREYIMERDNAKD